MYKNFIKKLEADLNIRYNQIVLQKSVVFTTMEKSRREPQDNKEI